MIIENIEEEPSHFQMNGEHKRKSSFLSIDLTTNSLKSSTKTIISFTQYNLSGKVEKECRVCLDSSDQKKNPLISPCSCTGSVQYIHENCFRTWVQKLFEDAENENKKQHRDYSICQLCKAKMNVKLEKQYVCSSKLQIQEKINKNVLLFLLLLFFVLLSTCLLGYLFSRTLTSLSDMSSSIIMGIVISLHILLGLAFLFTTGYFIREYFVHTELNIQINRGSEQKNSERCRRVYPENINDSLQ